MDLENSLNLKTKKELQTQPESSTQKDRNLTKTDEEILERPKKITGYRSQFQRGFGLVIGERATEGEGIYVSLSPAKNWAHYVAPNKFQIEFYPKKILPGEEAYFYRLSEYPDEANKILEPLKESDSIWLRLNKLALEKSGYLTENKEEAIKNFGKILKDLIIKEGYDAVSLETPTEGKHLVILDKNIISKFENVSLKMSNIFRGKFDEQPKEIKSQSSPEYEKWYNGQIKKLDTLWKIETGLSNLSEKTKQKITNILKILKKMPFTEKEINKLKFNPILFFEEELSASKRRIENYKGNDLEIKRWFEEDINETEEILFDLKRNFK